MSKLFTEIYLDENVRVLIAKIVQSHGFKAVKTQEIGRRGISDPEQLKYANDLNYAILTHNRVDFEELAKDCFALGKNHCRNNYRRRQLASRDCPPAAGYLKRLHGG